jgi:hypothetical protein
VAGVSSARSAVFEGEALRFELTHSRPSGTLHFVSILRRAVVPLLALALASCWLTASLNETSDAGPSDASIDARTRDGGGDGAIDSGLDARHDGAMPQSDAGDAADSDAALPSEASCTSSTTYEESVRSASPLGFWPLDEDGGTTIAMDRSGNGNDATYSNLGITYDQPGVAGARSVFLDGTRGEVLVDGSGFAEFADTAPYSLEAWIRPMGMTSGYEGIVSNEPDGDAGKEGYVMYLEDEGGIGFDRYANGTSTPLTEAGAVSTLGKSWYHVVAVYDGKTAATMSLYINGKFVTSKPTKLKILAGCTFAIGASHCGTIGWFRGYMAEVAVYPSALEPTCIARHYQLGM